MQTYLICFDIENDRLRYRVGRDILHYGYRVQHSVFEVAFKRSADLNRLRRRLYHLGEEYNELLDIRFYRMNKTTEKSSFTLDEKPIMHFQGSLVI